MNLENIMLTEKSQTQKILFRVSPIPQVVQWKRIRLPMQDILDRVTKNWTQPKRLSAHTHKRREAWFWKPLFQKALLNSSQGC